MRDILVRLWRSEFARGGIETLRATITPGPAPMKSEAALRVVTPLLEAPVADRPNWTIARLKGEIEACEGGAITVARESAFLFPSNHLRRGTRTLQMAERPAKQAVGFVHGSPA